MSSVSITININSDEEPEVSSSRGGTIPPGVGGVAPPSLGDDDPGAPIGDDEIDEILDLTTGSILANLGRGFDPDDTAGDISVPPSGSDPAVPPPAEMLLTMNFLEVKKFLKDCRDAGVKYGLGAKVPYHKAPPSTWKKKKIDCSGFVREAIRLATKAKFPDGSVVQHDWVRDRDFSRCDRSEGKLNDDYVRIAFMRPQDLSQGIGHVVLIAKGWTYESHGGTGPNSREWTVQGWQAKSYVYRLAKL